MTPPLVDFVWDDRITEVDGVRGVRGTAKDADTGAIVPVCVTEDKLRSLKAADKAPEKPN